MCKVRGSIGSERGSDVVEKQVKEKNYKVKCVVTGEKLLKSLCTQGKDGKYVRSDLYETYWINKEKKAECVKLFKKKVGIPERYPAPVINKFINDMSEMFDPAIILETLELEFNHKGGDLYQRTSYVIAVVRNQIVKVSEEFYERKKRTETGVTAIILPEELTEEAVTVTRPKKKGLFSI